MRKLVLIALGVILIIGLAYTTKEYFNTTPCSVTVDDGVRSETYICGLKYKGLSETNDTYIGKVIKFLNKDNQVYVTIDFGFITANLPLGHIGKDRVLIKPLSRISFTQAENVNPSDYHLLSESSAYDYNSRYQNTYVQLIFLSPTLIRKSISQWESLASDQNNIDNTGREYYSNLAKFWSGCVNTYSIFWDTMRNPGPSSEFVHWKNLLTNPNYRSCLPLLDTISVYQ